MFLAQVKTKHVKVLGKQAGQKWDPKTSIISKDEAFKWHGDQGKLAPKPSIDIS